MERMVELVNKTWKQRGSIQPSQVKRERPKALDVYKLLPRQNCKACGQPTCFTFALKLTAGQANIAACTPLFTDGQRAKRERLLQVLQPADIL